MIDFGYIEFKVGEFFDSASVFIMAGLLVLLLALLISLPIVGIVVIGHIEDGLNGKGEYRITVEDRDTKSTATYSHAYYTQERVGYIIYTDGSTIYTGDSIVYIEEEK